MSITKDKQRVVGCNVVLSEKSIKYLEDLTCGFEDDSCEVIESALSMFRVTNRLENLPPLVALWIKCKTCDMDYHTNLCESFIDLIEERGL